VPVIGRLDKQVDERIISPISNRRRDEDAPPRSGDDQDPPAPHTQTPPAGESSAKIDELPVWLL
jgi:hypothetical protein